MVAPEVFVVVELGLARAGVLAAKDPHLASGRGRDDGLVGAARRRTRRGDDLTPLPPLRVVEQEVVVQQGLHSQNNRLEIQEH